MQTKLVYLQEILNTQNKELAAVLSLPDRNVNQFKDMAKTRLTIKLRGKIRHSEVLIRFEEVAIKINNSVRRD